jgi:hypothetical protein
MDEGGKRHALLTALSTHNTGGQKDSRAGLDIVVNKTSVKQACKIILYGVNMNCDTNHNSKFNISHIKGEYFQKKITLQTISLVITFLNLYHII